MPGSNGPIAPLPTPYNGVLYRSRCEARWAIVFDRLGLAFEYEPQGFDLDGDWYLPDFYIHDFNHYVEIKGTAPTGREISLCRRLARYAQTFVLLYSGAPGSGPGRSSSVLCFEPDQAAYVLPTFEQIAWRGAIDAARTARFGVHAA